MELAETLRILWSRRLLVAAGVFVAAFVAWATAFDVSFPPTLEPGSIEYGAASTHVLLDAQTFALTDIEAPLDVLEDRAEVFARLAESDAVRTVVAAEAGLRPDQFVIGSKTPSESSTTRRASDPRAEERANAVAVEEVPKRVLVTAEEGLPVLAISTQAGTVRAAMDLADATARGLIKYLRTLERARSTPPERRLALRQLGVAEGAVVNEGASRSLAALSFVVVLALWCALVVVVSNVVDSLRALKELETCGACGAELPAEARFCARCGRPVTTTRRPVSDAVLLRPTAADESVQLVAGARPSATKALPGKRGAAAPTSSKARSASRAKHRPDASA